MFFARQCARAAAGDNFAFRNVRADAVNVVFASVVFMCFVGDYANTAARMEALTSAAIVSSGTSTACSATGEVVLCLFLIDSVVLRKVLDAARCLRFVYSVQPARCLR